MSYQDVLTVVGDQTRRSILEMIRERPMAVGQIAEGLPVSRPAVSKHLRVLKAAGLVADVAEGTRRIYHLRPEGFAEVRDYWDGFWNRALVQFKDFAETYGRSET